MEIHKPKPIHNWREFLKEVGTIVLGVVIALAAEQSVEWWHWQHRVKDAMEAIRLELRDDDGPQAFTRAAAVNCFDRQLDAIRAAVEAGSSRAQIAALTGRYATPRVTWDSTAWNAVLASDVASHVPPDEMIKWGLAYSAIPKANALEDQEADALAALRPVRQKGDVLAAGEADTILTAVARLRDINRRFGIGGAGFLSYMEKSGVVLTPQQEGRILRDLRALYPGCVVVPARRTLDPGDLTDDMRRAMGAARGR